MPMIGHIAQTGQVVATDFRPGNTAPAKDNLAFIKHCQQALPSEVNVNKLRIDAAGYQAKIINYCSSQDIQFAIRAKLCATLKDIIIDKDNQWQSLLNKQGKPIQGQDTFRMQHYLGKDGEVFDLIVQRVQIKGQIEMDLGVDDDAEQSLAVGEFVYRGIASNLKDWSDSKIIHFYNQRAQDSENRIKELKNDFGAKQMPCGDFAANALYFDICSLSYNLFALMRQLLPLEFANKRAKYVRHRLYAIAAKVISHGRQVIVKCQSHYYGELTQALKRIKMFKPLLV